MTTICQMPLWVLGFYMGFTVFALVYLLYGGKG